MTVCSDLLDSLRSILLRSRLRYRRKRFTSIVLKPASVSISSLSSNKSSTSVAPVVSLNVSSLLGTCARAKKSSKEEHGGASTILMTQYEAERSGRQASLNKKKISK